MEQIAIVILNWNGLKWLKQFLSTVEECSPGARVIVADNASNDNSVDYLREHHPHVEIIINKQNGGFAQGYNEALKRIDAPYYMLLNSDVEVTPNWLEPLLAVMNEKQIAGVQPKIKAFDRKSEFEHAGASGGYIDRNYYPFCRGRMLTFCEQDEGQYDRRADVFWTSGACMLIRSEIFHEVGGFDADFFAHMEEIDLCWRIKRRGYNFIVEPNSVVYHVGGGTLAYQSPKKTYLNFRNNLYMIIKNHPGWLLPKLFYRLCLDGVAGMLFFVKGEFRHLWAVFQAHMSMYANLGSMLQKRKQLKTFDLNVNNKGKYGGSLLWAYYFKRIRNFDQLNARFFKND